MRVHGPEIVIKTCIAIRKDEEGRGREEEEFFSFSVGTLFIFRRFAVKSKGKKSSLRLA